MSLWAAKATIESKGTPLDISVQRVKDVLGSEKQAIQAMGMRLVRIDKDEKHLFLCGIYEPIWPKIYVLTPYMLVIALAIGIIFGRWFGFYGVAIVAGSYFFYSATYAYIVFRLLMRKSGYKGSIVRMPSGEALKHYIKQWGSKKS